MNVFKTFDVSVYYRNPLDSTLHNKVKVTKAVKFVTDSSLIEAKRCVEAKGLLKGRVVFRSEDNGTKLNNWLTLIHQSGGVTNFGECEWAPYEEQLKEMLFQAQMHGHALVIMDIETKLDIIKNYKEHQSLLKENNDASSC